MHIANTYKASLFKSLCVLLLMGLYFSVVVTHLFFVPNFHARASRHSSNPVFKRKSDNYSVVRLAEKYVVTNKKSFQELRKIYKELPGLYAGEVVQLSLSKHEDRLLAGHIPDQRYCYLSNCIIRV